MSSKLDNSTEEPKEKTYTRCLRCHRKLKDLESQKIGMGKTCYAKYKKEEIHKKLF